MSETRFGHFGSLWLRHEYFCPLSPALSRVRPKKCENWQKIGIGIDVRKPTLSYINAMVFWQVYKKCGVVKGKSCTVRLDLWWSTLQFDSFTNRWCNLSLDTFFSHYFWIISLVMTLTIKVKVLIRSMPRIPKLCHHFCSRQSSIFNW